MNPLHRITIRPVAPNVPEWHTVDCPNCGAAHQPVSGQDEDGMGYSYLETTKCAGCGAELCGCCPQRVCDDCHGVFCEPCSVEDDGVFCSACHAKYAGMAQLYRFLASRAPELLARLSEDN